MSMQFFTSTELNHSFSEFVFLIFNGSTALERQDLLIINASW